MKEGEILMRQIAIIFLSFVSISASAQCRHFCCEHKDTVQTEQQEYSPSVLIIWYDASKKSYKKRLMKAVRKYGAKVIYDYKSFNGIAISIPKDKNLEKAIAYFSKVKGVLQVNKDRMYHLD